MNAGKYLYSIWFSLVMAVLAPTAAAQNSLSTNNLLDNASTIGSNDISLAGENGILDFDEAYVLSVDVTSANSIELNWAIEPGYYLYREKYLSIDAYVNGESTAVEYSLPAGVVKHDENFNEDIEVYFHQVTIPITFPAINSAGINRPDTRETSIVKLSMRVLGCKDNEACYPPKTKYLKIDFDNGTAIPTGKFQLQPTTTGGGNPANVAAESTSQSTTQAVGVTQLLYLMLLAMVGGLILNLMPCVFPVLSLKALSFVSAKGSEHSHHVHGWVYTAGVVGSFLVMGVIIVTIRATGGNADWGMQLQSPVFVAMMVYLFLVMGLSLSGFIHFGSSLMGIGQSLTTREGLQGSFFTGVLAVVVASPCSAPFMATALGVAFTQSTAVALLILTSMGLGLALPFLILSHSPKLAAFLPKPGAWMETLKQVLAFPLYLTAVGGLWVLGRQTSADTIAVVILGAVAIVFAAWLWQKRPRTSLGKYSQITACVLALVGGLNLAVQAPQYGKGSYWQEYSPELLAQLRAEGRPVFINLTAAWCVTCHANERIALNREQVKATVEKYNVAMIKGDYTNEDPRITELLHKYQRAAVPLYLMYSADSAKPVEILPQLLTVDTVVTAMERAATQTVAHQ